MLGLFLSLGIYVSSSLESLFSARTTVEKVYAKQQGYHALVSLIPHLKEALRTEDMSFDSLLDPWAFPFEVETERGILKVEIRDEDRFINVARAVSEPKLERALRRLFSKVGVDPSKVDLIKRWAKRRKIRSLYDLLRMGFTEEEFSRVKGFLTLWSFGKVNVNTAPEEVLTSLDEELDEVVVERILRRRSKEPFRRVEDLVLVDGVTFDTLYRIRDLIDVSSRVFRIEATVKVGDVETTLVLIYDRVSGRILYKKVY